jgi:hypothetical protein
MFIHPPTKISTCHNWTYRNLDQLHWPDWQQPHFSPAQSGPRICQNLMAGLTQRSCWTPELACRRRPWQSTRHMEVSWNSQHCDALLWTNSLAFWNDLWGNAVERGGVCQYLFTAFHWLAKFRRAPADRGHQANLHIMNSYRNTGLPLAILCSSCRAQSFTGWSTITRDAKIDAPYPSAAALSTMLRTTTLSHCNMWFSGICPAGTFQPNHNDFARLIRFARLRDVPKMVRIGWSEMAPQIGEIHSQKIC